MKLRMMFIIMITLFIIVGCQSPKIEKPQLVETIKAEEVHNNNENIQNNEDLSKDSEKSLSQNEYIGQALDTLESDGIVEVYKEKDKKSEVIYNLKDYEEVNLLETLPYGWFKVKLNDGREGYVDALYVRTKEIPPHDYNEKIEGYVLIFTHDDQTLRIYKDGELIIESLASSGLWDHFTPKGIFEIEDQNKRRGKWAYIKRFNQGFKYWVGFRRTYLFHSVPFTEDGQLIEEEAVKLGQPASHGCIRLPVDVAKYIYENVPEGSLVLIY